MRREFDTSTRMEHLFEAMGEIQRDYPASRISSVANGEKGVEEALEFLHEATDDPTQAQLDRMFKENTDRLLNALWFFHDWGVTPILALDMGLAKLIEVRQRWETGIYPRPKPEKQEGVIYERLEDDYLGPIEME